jgi:HlyD family secretion protein
MKTSLKAIIVGAVVLVAAVCILIALRPLLSPRESLRYISRPVGYADIAATVNETGTVNPVNEVLVGSEVSGTIKTLTVDYNSRVHVGEIMATLDPTTYQAAANSAQASLQLAQANLHSAEVNVSKMKALLDMANLTLQRDEPLLKQGLINQNQMDTDNTAAIGAEQDYLASQASVQVGQAQVTVARSQLEQAQYNLSKTVIKSPLDGIVMARNVSVGQTVAASLQAPTLFTLATSLADMQVDTSVDEADAGSVRRGAAAQFTVTAFPNESFAGTVQEVRINPTVVQNVVTYDAVVRVHDSSGRLLPGMTAQVSIEVGKRAHTLAVPIMALLYRPLATQTAPASQGFNIGAGVGQGQGAASPGSQVAGAPGSQVTVWLLRDGRPVPVQVVIGLSDGQNVEITGGNLHEGDQVITAQRRATGRNGGPGAGNAGGNGAGAAGGSGAGRNGTAAAGSRRGP